MSDIRILALDSSSTPASAAIVEDGRILAEFFLNTRLTHSQTLMPMVRAVLDITGTAAPDMIAVTHGPGSFTGVRIGIASAKGLALPGEIPCVGLSALEALAYNYLGDMRDMTLCAALDARCGQVYGALFSLVGGVPTRLTQDSVLPVEDFCAKAAARGGQLLFLGDGAQLCQKNLPDAMLATENNRYQRASSAAFAAVKKRWVTADELQPLYLQIPQAQRELSKRLKKEQP